MRGSEAWWKAHARILAAVPIFGLAACPSEAPPPPEGGPVTVASASDGVLSVDLLVRAAAGLAVGRNTVGLRVTEDATGEAIAAATITPSWVMTMAGETHGCPHRDPVGAADAEGLFPAVVVLPMPSSTGGTWASTVTVRRDDGAEHSLIFPDLTVANSEGARTVVGTEGVSYLVSLSFAEGDAPAREAEVGDNAVLVTAHAQRGPTDFEAVDDLAVSVAADMPSMGHGSSTPSSATARGDGEYAGQAELSMPGAWVVTVTLQRAGESVAVAEFDVAL